jgi:amino acid permease
MTKVWVGVIAFAGGVGVGLLVAKLYARSQVQGGIHSLLDNFGLAGGKVEAVTQALGANLV